MFPERLPDTVASAAERDLFAAFRDRVSERRTVLAGVNWIYTNDRGQARTAEADIVVLDPDRGILVIEVKGGTVGHDARSGRWYSISRGGHDNTIKDPVEQARRAFFDIRKQLQAERTSARFRYQGGYGLAFTDASADGVEFPADAPRAIIIDANDLDDLDARIDAIFRYWRAPNDPTPGDGGVEAAAGLMARSWELRSPLILDFKRESSQIRTLTEGQFTLIQQLDSNPRLLISGCAGSGKTFLAAEKAKQLAERGIPTLLTCFNKALAAWLRERLSPYPETLHIQHFHEFAHDYAQQAGLDPTWPEGMDGPTYFNVLQPSLLMEAIELSDRRFDAIVVDEGQDFRDEWWLGLLELLRDPEEGIFYIFYDEQQSIYNQDQAFPFSGMMVTLNENLRNTKGIHDHIAHFYDERVSSAGPEGRPPVLIETDDPAVALGHQLRRLILDEDLNPSDIVVLTPASERRSIWRTGQRAGRYRLTWSDPPPKGEILVSTIHSFKGLECPVVILTETASLAPDDHLYLVACSRAKHELVVLRDR